MIPQTPDTINPNVDETGHVHTWCDPQECAAGYRARFVDIGHRYGAAVIEQHGDDMPTLTLPKLKIYGPADRFDLGIALIAYDRALTEYDPRTARNVRAIIEDSRHDDLDGQTPCAIEYAQEDGLDGWNNTAEAAHWLATGGVERTPEAALRAFLTGDPYGVVCAVDCPQHADEDLEVFDDEELAKDPANFSTVIDSDGIHVEGRRNLTAAQARSMARLLLQSARDLELIEDGE